MISLGQKNTLAEYMILSGADNHPPMLEKDLYDSWKSRMELYMQNREHRRMILKSVENGPLIWPTVEQNGLLANIYSLVNRHKVAKDLWERVQLLMQGTSLTKPERECKLYDGFNKYTHIKGESLHTYYLRFTQLINHMNIYKMKIEQFQVNTKFLNILPLEWSKFVTDDKLVKDLHTSNFNKLHAYLEQHELHANEVRFAVLVFSPGDDPIACLNKAMAFLTAVASSRFPTTNNQLKTSSNPRNQATIQDGWVTPKRPRNAAWYKEKAMLAEAQEAGQILDEEQLAFLTDRGIPTDQAQTIILHNTAFQTEDLDTYDSDCDDLSTAQAILMANISNYGSDIISEVPNSENYLNDMDNQSVLALQDFEQSPVMDVTDNEISSDSNIIPYSQYLQETQQATVQDTNLQAQQDSMILSVIEQISREKMIDSQMDDMIREKLALKEQIDSLEQNLSKQIKEKESLFKTFIVFKNESKEKENKYMENEIDLENKIKELDNIVYKVGQSAQTVHMLTKPQAFYDNTHKQALGYQNPFYLRKAQRIKPTLYDGAVISKTHVAMPVIDDEETLILEEESRSKMFEKAKDPEVSLVNASLKKLKFHLTQFDYVVKTRTTPSALEEGEWGFEHTKAVFNNEIIPFLKSLKDIFNVFDKDLLNEITEVQTVFDQMEASVQQFSVDKKCLEIAKKEILLENDRLLQKVMSQDVLITVMNSMSLNNDSVNVKMQKCELCEKCLNLDAELSKSKQAYNDLLKNHSQLEKHCISLEVSMQLKQEVFQNDESFVNQNAVEIQEYFEINDLKARLQDKDTTISKLKDTIKSLKKNTKEKSVNHNKCDLEPINEELENSVAKLLSENERLCNEINHVKRVFKDQFDSIK
ncbi:hypothetical protein Tco_0824757 [Tanacetum coccineum]|uniref:Integrase, catalytic region, zinc finger, CCHC-type, peptidase aspartic, catalytic n=1 Tax=Tanacetum coccineum TaxID=301880 RepID=A0ABQ5AQZ5_9ASTR